MEQESQENGMVCQSNDLTVFFGHFSGASYFLGGHDISVNIRSKLVDWIYKVIKIIRFEEKTFFLTIELIDRYLSAL